MVKTASCNNKGAYSNSLVCSSLLSYIALRICTDKSSKGTRIPQTWLYILCIRVVKRALLTSISAKAAFAAYSGVVLYKRYEQQVKATTFLKNDMREGLSPCRKQVILNPSTQSDGCESNQVIVSCNSAVVIICSVELYPEVLYSCRENGYQRHIQQSVFKTYGNYNW